MSLSDHHIDLGLLGFASKLDIETKQNGRYILDPIRKKWLSVQPEEIVRQACIVWLIAQGFHRNSIQVEKKMSINGLSRRFDIVVYDSTIQPLILIECKAPTVAITQITFDQLSAYQSALHAKYLIVTNGVQNFIASLDSAQNQYRFYHQIPDWDTK